MAIALIPPELQALLALCLAGGSRKAKILRVQSALAGNQSLRDALGAWIARILSVDALVPPIYRQWRPLIQDSFRFVFARLSDERLAVKLVEQVDLPLDTPAASRLLRLLSKMPGIQKLGQVLEIGAGC